MCIILYQLISEKTIDVRENVYIRDLILIDVICRNDKKKSDFISEETERFLS